MQWFTDTAGINRLQNNHVTEYALSVHLHSEVYDRVPSGVLILMGDNGLQHAYRNMHPSAYIRVLMFDNGGPSWG